MSKFMLIPVFYKDNIIEAINVRYEWWKQEDERHEEELRRMGGMTVYSNTHTIFEWPIARLNNAECVSRDEHGLLCRPDANLGCYLMIGEQCKRDLVRLLRAAARDNGASMVSADIVESAMVVELPEIHNFVDANDDKWQIIGWDGQDAEQRLLNSGRGVKAPLEWHGAQTAWCDTGGVYVGKFDPIADEPSPDEPYEQQVVGESSQDFGQVNLQVGEDEIPF
ncbi:MAG: hypothetical protein HY231_24215 [Acidobacteria bacterium]|nr:hypothetical protein [Acidobacteriota bacterium]